MNTKIIKWIFISSITIILGMYSGYAYVSNPNPFDAVAIKIVGVLVFLYLQFLVGYFNWISLGFVSFGAFSNGIALALNGGYMPATACTASTGINIPIKGANAQFLCDWILGVASIGDVVEITGFMIFLISFLRYSHRKISTTYSQL